MLPVTIPEPPFNSHKAISDPAIISQSRVQALFGAANAVIEKEDCVLTCYPLLILPTTQIFYFPRWCFSYFPMFLTEHELFFNYNAQILKSFLEQCCVRIASHRQSVQHESLYAALKIMALITAGDAVGGNLAANCRNPSLSCYLVAVMQNLISLVLYE